MGGREKSSVFTGRVTTPTGRGGYCHDDDHQPFSFPSSGINYGNINNPKRKKKGEHTLVRAAAAMTLALFRLFDFLLEKIMIHSFVVSSSVCGDKSLGS